MPIGNRVDVAFDTVPVLGLEAVEDSLAYRVTKVERAVNNYERWFGAAVTPNGEIHVADRIGPGVGTFQADAGNEDWGEWVQILGSGDTPAIAGKVRYKLHRLLVIESQHDDAYFFQIAFGESGAAALAANTYSDVIFKPETNLFDSGPSDLLMDIADAGTKAWLRTLCLNQNTGTINFFIAINEFEG